MRREGPVAKDVDQWITRLGPQEAAALTKLRAQIRKAAPQAEETISYGLPTFTFHGHLVAYGAFKKHLSFFPMSARLIRQLPEAAPFIASTGTLRFQPDRPIPAALITKMVKARIAENLALAQARTAQKATTRAAATPRPPSKPASRSQRRRPGTSARQFRPGSRRP